MAWGPLVGLRSILAIAELAVARYSVVAKDFQFLPSYFVGDNETAITFFARKLCFVTKSSAATNQTNLIVRCKDLSSEQLVSMGFEGNKENDSRIIGKADH